jgi:hypothetical protein
MTKVKVWSSEKVYYYNEVEIDGKVTDDKVKQAMKQLTDSGYFNTEVVDSETYKLVDGYEKIVEPEQQSAKEKMFQSFANYIVDLSIYKLEKMLKTEKEYWKQCLIKEQIRLDLEDALDMMEETSR